MRSPVRLVLVTLLCAACPGAVAAPDTESEVRRAIEGLGVRGITAEVGGEPLVFDTLTLSEIAVQPGAPSRALFHVVGVGRLGTTAVGYYGSEAVAVRDGKSLAPDGAWLPRLQGVLSALKARETALQRRDAPGLAALAVGDYREGSLTLKALPALVAVAEAPAPASTVSGRVDGARAEVTQVVGDAGGLHALSLVRVGESWRFSSGLL